jgi:hypothetical protein
MICEDMTMVVDTRSISALTAAERSELETHARTCARCASQWGVEMGLAAVRIPRMSPALLNRCRPGADASNAAPVRRRILRPAVLVGAVVALAAAAAIQAVRQTGAKPPSQQTAELQVAPAEISQQPPDLATPSANIQGPDSPVVIVSAAQLPPLPLLPLPVAASRRTEDLRSRMDWALARAIERHPELVDGPERDGRLVVAIALYEDGRILSEQMRFASEVEFRSIETELRQTLPQGGRQQHGGRQKGSRLPDGRVLHNDVVLHVGLVPNQYDHSRSSNQVAEIVRANHADLMVSATSPEFRWLVVFMSEDGQIARESYVNEPLKGRGVLRADDPESVAFLAQQISTILGVDINRIGLLGIASLQAGPATVGNPDGSSNVSDKLRVLPVLYAWPRRAAENGPAWGEPVASAGPKLDKAAALAIVERHMPDAFVRTADTAVGQPAIVLTVDGKFMRSTRLLNQGPIDQRRLQIEQLRNVIYSTTERLKSPAGQMADVTFLWEKADPGK